MIKLLGAKTPDAGFPSSRIEAFSDGVIAIIITLMILEIKIPDLHKETQTKSMWMALKPMLAHVFAYLLSFVMLGIYWVNHHNFFHKIQYADRRLLWLNLNLLFWFSLIPIPTAIIGEMPLEPASSLLYGGVLFLSSSSFTYMGIYANKKGLFTGKIPEAIRKKNMRRNLFSLSLYVIAMLMAYVHVYISFAVFVFVAAMYFMPRLGIKIEDNAKEVAPVQPAIEDTKPKGEANITEPKPGNTKPNKPAK